MLNILKK